MEAFPSTTLELEIGDGIYRCKLNLPQIAELQTKCGIPVRHPEYGEMIKPTGIGAVTARVLKGRYKLRDGSVFGEPLEAEFFAHDCLEVVRLALIGGGGGIVDGEDVAVDAIRARQIMDRYVQPMPWDRIWELAAAILLANIHGYSPTAKEAAPPPKKARAPRKTGVSSTTPAP